MSLATRCIHCGTIFKIVEDQLKVSQGWVRCGRCHEVFNALPTLFDMDREPPPPRVSSAPRPDEPGLAPKGPAAISSPSAQLSPRTQAERLTEDDFPTEPVRSVRAATDFELDTHVSSAEIRSDSLDPPDTRLPPLDDTEHTWEPPTPSPDISSSKQPALAPPRLPAKELPSTDDADALDSRYLISPDRDRMMPQRRQSGPDFAGAEFSADALLDATPDDQAELHQGFPKAESVIPLPPETPKFIRQAQKEAFWRHPSIRGLLTGLVLALMLSLSMQVVHHFRDILAAQHLAWRDGLSRWCALAHCTLKPPLSINDLQVESATLMRAESDGTHRYRLAVVVRNRANIPLSWPHVDLTLTDAAGVSIARRSLSPTDAKLSSVNNVSRAFEAHPPAVAPKSSTTLTWYLRAPSLKPAGYTAELFYP